jgi:hypothetical protein
MCGVHQVCEGGRKDDGAAGLVEGKTAGVSNTLYQHVNTNCFLALINWKMGKGLGTSV